MPDGLLNITAIIYFNVYTYELPAVANVAPKTNLPSAFALVAPSNLSFVDTDDSTTGRPYLTWTAVDTYPVNEYRVIVKSGSVAVYNNIVTSNYAFLDFLPTGSYTAEVTAINSVKAESEAGTLSFSIADQPVTTTDIKDAAVNVAKLASDVISAINAGGTGSTQLIKATSAPSTRTDGSALQAQDIWADTDDNNQIYVRNASNNGWDKARDATLVTLYNSLNSTVTSQGTALATAQADIITVTTSAGANATAITDLTATVGTNTAGVSTVSTAIATINGNASASYVLKLNANGKVAQMVLNSNANSGSGATSTISFLADTFGIDNGSGTSITPFIVTNGTVFINNARINELEATKLKLDGVTISSDSNGNLIIKNDGVSSAQMGTRAVGAMVVNGAAGSSNFGDGRTSDNFASLIQATFTTAESGDYQIVANCMVGGTINNLTQVESRIRIGSTVIADYESPVGGNMLQPIILGGKISLAANTSYTAILEGQVIQDNSGVTPAIAGFSTRITALKLNKQ